MRKCIDDKGKDALVDLLARQLITVIKTAALLSGQSGDADVPQKIVTRLETESKNLTDEEGDAFDIIFAYSGDETVEPESPVKAKPETPAEINPEPITGD